MKARYGDNARVSRKSFARCLAALGGKFKRVKGMNYWTNVGMRRAARYVRDPI
jgi:hypothetical protein